MTRLTIAAVLALGLAACQQPDTTVSNNQTQGQTDEAVVENLGNAMPQAPGTVMPAAEFAATAAGRDLFEIASGRLAQQKGQSDAVKSMGEMLVEEHTKSSNELKTMLQGVTPPVALPTGPPPELQARIDALAALQGEEFDKQWVSEQIAVHQQTLAELNGYIAKGDSSTLKDWASRATGVVQKHLNELNQLNK